MTWEWHSQFGEHLLKQLLTDFWIKHKYLTGYFAADSQNIYFFIYLFLIEGEVISQQP